MGELPDVMTVVEVVNGIEPKSAWQTRLKSGTISQIALARQGALCAGCEAQGFASH